MLVTYPKSNSQWFSGLQNNFGPWSRTKKVLDKIRGSQTIPFYWIATHLSLWRNRETREEKKEESLNPVHTLWKMRYLIWLPQNLALWHCFPLFFFAFSLRARTHRTLNRVEWDETPIIVLMLGKSQSLSVSPPQPLWSVSLTTCPDFPFLCLETQVQAWATKVWGASVRWMTILSSISQMSNSVYNQAQILPT